MGKYVWMYFQAFFVLFLAILFAELILFSKIPKNYSQVGRVETDEHDKNKSEFPYSVLQKLQKLCVSYKKFAIFRMVETMNIIPQENNLGTWKLVLFNSTWTRSVLVLE